MITEVVLSIELYVGEEFGKWRLETIQEGKGEGFILQSQITCFECLVF